MKLPRLSINVDFGTKPEAKGASPVHEVTDLRGAEPGPGASAEVELKSKEPRVTGSARVDKSEIGAVVDDFITALGIDSTNPDQQIAHFGLKWMQDHEVKDCHYRNCLRILKSAILARKVDVEPWGEEAEAQRQAGLVSWNIENIIGGFKRDMREACDALSLGYSVQEIIWDIVPFGDFKGMAYIKELRHKPPENYNFKLNRFGRIEQFKQLTSAGGLMSEPVPLEKFVVWSFDSNYENPYGRGLMSSCAWPIWFKKNGAKWLNVYAEKFAMPITKVTTPRELSEADKERLTAIMKAIQANTGIQVPDGFLVEFLEAQRRGGDIYKQLLEWCDQQISYAVLGVILATSPGEGGTYLLGKAQIKDIMESKVVQDIADELEGVLQEQFVKRLIGSYNFETDSYPQVKLRLPKSYADLDAQMLKVLLEAGWEPPVTWANDRWGVPEGEDGDKLLTASGMKIKGEKPTEPGEGMVELAERDTGWRTPWIVEFTEAAGRREDGYVGLAMKEINGLVREALDSYLRAIEDAQIIENGTVEALSAITPDFGKVYDLLRRLFYVGSLAGITDAQRLVWQRGWRPKTELPGGAIFDEDATFLEFQEPGWDMLPDERAALRYFSGLQKVTRDVYNIGLLNGNAFTISGVESSSAVKLVHGHILEALQNGWSFREFRAALMADKIFIGSYYPPSGISQNAHWETVFRTNVNSAYNRGRLGFYNDPDLEGFVVAYRYNAILDDRVRPAHAAMDGRVYAKDSPIWFEWLPPNGYSCRCYIDPIEASAYLGDSTKPATARTSDGKVVAVQPDKGFGSHVVIEPVAVRIPEPIPVGRGS